MRLLQHSGRVRHIVVHIRNRWWINYISQTIRMDLNVGLTNWCWQYNHYDFIYYEQFDTVAHIYGVEMLNPIIHNFVRSQFIVVSCLDNYCFDISQIMINLICRVVFVTALFWLQFILAIISWKHHKSVCILPFFWCNCTCVCVCVCIVVKVMQ